MNPSSSRTSWLTELWTWLATLSGIGYLFTAYSVSRWLTRTSPDCSNPDLPDWSWENVECHAADGVRLAGWAASPGAPRATVVLFHGLRGNRGRMRSRMAFLLKAGYRCVAFDHRGHGESGGRWTSFGYHESRDVQAVLDFVRARWPEQPHAVLGVSMGGAALCFAARHVRGCQAVILESVYHDLESAFRNRVGIDYPAWFNRFRSGVIWVTERRLGLRLPDLAPALHVHELTPAPVLLLTGSDDPHAPPEDVSRLHSLCSEPRELRIIPGAGHDDIMEKAGDHYRGLVLDFLSRTLPPALGAS